MKSFDGEVLASEILSELSRFLPLYQAREFVSYLLGVDYKDLHNHLSRKIELRGYKKFIVRKVFEGYPVSYVTKSREFFGYEFYVDERVLIPRHETEILVEEALKIDIKKPKVLDICTGSGVILATYLLKKGDATGLGVDISLPALEVAMINLRKYNLLDRACLVCLDAVKDLESVKISEFDIILCNPPYISKSEKLSDSVLYEPHQALFAEDDGYYFYKKLLRILYKSCKEDTIIFFEIGGGMSEELKKIFSGKEISFIEDYAGKKRVLRWINSK